MLINKLKQRKDKSYKSIVVIGITMLVFIVSETCKTLLNNLLNYNFLYSAFFVDVFSNNVFFNVFNTMTLFIFIFCICDFIKNKNKMNKSKLELTNLLLSISILIAVIIDFSLSFISTNSIVYEDFFFVISYINLFDGTILFTVKVLPFIIIFDIIGMVIYQYIYLHPKKVIYIDENGKQIRRK